MGDYLWPGLVAAILMGYAAWRFTKCWSARRSAWAAWAAVGAALAKRREAGLELAAAMRAFRPRDPAALTRLDSAAAAARNAERHGPDERREPEAAFDEALSRLPALVESDPLLRIHAGCRHALEKLAGSEAELRTAVAGHNGLVRAYEAEARTFPNNVVLHVMDFSPPQEWAPSPPPPGRQTASAA